MSGGNEVCRRFVFLVKSQKLCLQVIRSFHTSLVQAISLSVRDFGAQISLILEQNNFTNSACRPTENSYEKIVEHRISLMNIQDGPMKRNRSGFCQLAFKKKTVDFVDFYFEKKKFCAYFKFCQFHPDGEVTSNPFLSLLGSIRIYSTYCI